VGGIALIGVGDLREYPPQFPLPHQWCHGLPELVQVVTALDFVRPGIADVERVGVMRAQ
jgi:hypothetical protein